MINNMIKKNKGILILLLMIFVFTLVASRRVDKLEKIDDLNTFNLVYNK